MLFTVVEVVVSAGGFIDGFVTVSVVGFEIVWVVVSVVASVVGLADGFVVIWVVVAVVVVHEVVLFLQVQRFFKLAQLYF